MTLKENIIASFSEEFIRGDGDNYEGNVFEDGVTVIDWLSQKLSEVEAEVLKCVPEDQENTSSFWNGHNACRYAILTAIKKLFQ